MVYLVVPEQHKDGAWHFHGLFSNCEGLTMVDSGIKYDDNRNVYNIIDFKLGFTTALKSDGDPRISSYLVKYITKELITMSKGQHRYLYSKNLAKPQSETLFEEDLKFMELLLSKNKNLVKIKKVKDEDSGIETTYITIKKTE